MRKLVYIVDWLPPDYGAIGQYALQEAEQRARSGEHVVLVGLTTGPSSVESRVLGRGRLTISKLSSVPVDRVSFKRRAWWTLRTNARLVARAMRELVDAHEILFTASPPFLEHLLVPMSQFLRGTLVFRIADLHPECMMNELTRVPSWLRGFQSLARAMRRRAAVVEVLGEDQKKRLIADGIDPDRIVLRRSTCPVEIDAAIEPLPVPPSLRDRHVLLYSGAVAHAHDFTTFVEGYRRHHAEGSGRMGLWLNATGVRADAFEKAVVSHGLPVHRSLPVPLSDLASLLISPEAHLVTLRDEYVGLVVPSKIYGCIASGRDVLFVGSAESDVDLLCRRDLPVGAYERAAMGDASSVSDALERLADRADHRERLRRGASDAPRGG